MRTLTLTFEDTRCVICPAQGGSILSLEVDGIPLLRPAPDDCVDIEAVACFPLLPYANRIADGRFEAAGRAIALLDDPAALAHGLHGHGWRSAWTVIATDDRSATLEFRHAGGAWPWRYTAQQRIHLARNGISIAITIHNADMQPMPVGVGIHPFFIRAPDSSITADATAMWDMDHRGIAMAPTLDHPLAGEGPISIDMLEGTDNFFTLGGNGATINDGNRKVRIGTAAAEGIHVYAPPGRPFFCVEPVSHAPNSFARLPIPAAHWLASNESRTWPFTIEAVP